MTSSNQDTAFICQILILNTTETAGIGTLVPDKHILTCAHVVNRALGRGIGVQEAPAHNSRIRVRLPLAHPPRILTCAPEDFWLPPSLTFAFGDLAGLAVLDSDLDISEIPRAIIAAAPPVPDSPVRAFGYSGDPPRAEGSWASMWWRDTIGNGLVQLDQRLDSVIRAQPGFSGGPVLARRADSVEVVVGIFQAAPKDKQFRDGWALPVGPRLHEAWPTVLQVASKIRPSVPSRSPTTNVVPRSDTRFRVGDLNSRDLARVVAAAYQLANRDEVDVPALIQHWNSIVKERAARFVLASHAERSAPMLLRAIDMTPEWGGEEYFRGTAAAGLISPPHGVYIAGQLEDRLARVYAKSRLQASIVAAGRAGVTSAAPRLAELARSGVDYESRSIEALAYLYRSVRKQTQQAEQLRESILSELGTLITNYPQANIATAFYSLQPVHANTLLTLWISSDKETLTCHAANALGAMQLPRARQRLADRAAIATPDTDKVLLLNIGEIGGEASVELLLDRLEGPSSDAAHEGLLRCIEDASDDNFEGVIPDLLRKPSWHRWRAIRAAGRRKFEPAIDLVNKALTSDHPSERGSAALALSRITGRNKVALLEEARAGATDYVETVLCTEALLLATRDEDLVAEVNNALMADWQMMYFLIDRDLLQDTIDTLEIVGGAQGRELATALEWLTAPPINED